MSKINTTWLAGVAGVLTIAATAGLQTAQAQSRTADAPVSYGADEIGYSATGLTMKGRAELIQGDNRLRANQVEATTANNELTRIQATGDIYYVTPNETIRADRAVYTTSNDIIVMTGDVILTQGQNVMTGGRLTYNVRTQTAQMDAGASGRVQGVFYPQGSGT